MIVCGTILGVECMSFSVHFLLYMQCTFELFGAC